MRPIITLTTDFGHQDAFVGIMKGVILGIAPDVQIVDLCHEIPPQDLVAAALQLEAALPYFPVRTIHVVVVDPGVGTDRAAVAIETQRGILVGPDNGILVAALEERLDLERRAVKLTNAHFHLNPVSKTFHGRDLFAPVAAHLAAGVPLEELGEPVRELMTLALPHPVWDNGRLRATVIGHDRFGNLITDVHGYDLADFGEASLQVDIGDDLLIPIRGTFGDVAPGELVAYLASSGRLEIGVRNGSAKDELGSGRDLILKPGSGAS